MPGRVGIYRSLWYDFTQFMPRGTRPSDRFDVMRPSQEHTFQTALSGITSCRLISSPQLRSQLSTTVNGSGVVCSTGTATRNLVPSLVALASENQAKGVRNKS